MGNGIYEEFAAISGHVCDELFSIGEDGFRTKRMASIWKLPGGYQNSEGKLPQLRDHSCTSNEEFKGG